MKTIAVVLLVIASAGLGVASSGAARPEARTVSVDIREFQYRPPTLRVQPGTTVTWTNADEEPHTVTARNGGFASAGLDRSERFSRTFTERGTFEYFCALHPHMKATVVVQ